MTGRFARQLVQLVVLTVAFLSLFPAMPLLAQGQTASAPNIRASLIADGPAVPGQTLYLAIHFRPVSSKWHGYWRNPGDAGYAMQLDWSLPAGWKAGEPLYPVPQKLVIGGLMNHVYKGDYAVLVPVRIPRSAPIAQASEIGVEAQWLACSDRICVQEQGYLSTIARSSTGSPRDPRFADWQAAIPPLLDKTASYRIAKDRLRLAIPLPANVPLSGPHVFVGERDLVQYSAPQSFARDGDVLIAEIALSDTGNGLGTLSGILAFEQGRGVQFTANAGPVPAGGIPLASASGEAPNLALLVLAALAGGLILNIMPCVFPILSLKALSLARAGGGTGSGTGGGDDGRERAARREGIAYTAGVVLACLALGGAMLALRAAGQQVGWAFQLQEPWVVVCLMLLAAIITANLAGLFELPTIAITRKGEPASAFATGLLAAIAATPCTGPFMAAALGAALLLPTGAALLLFAALGLGLALPFLAIGLVPALRRKLPRPGAWMVRFRRILAVPMGVTALALIWLVSRLGGQSFALIALLLLAGLLMALFVVGKLQQAGKLAWPAFGLIAAPFVVFAAFALPASYQSTRVADARSILSPQIYSADNLRTARRSGQPVFLWFTADWCVTCKVNESVAIEREATRAAFEDAGVIAMRGDLTRRDAAITQYLSQQGVAGIPLYVWYEPDGEKTILPQVLTPDALVNLAQERSRRGTPP